MFHIENKKTKVIVKRKGVDFQWLHDSMSKEFPGCYVASELSNRFPLSSEHKRKALRR
jgi:hypothetical protein